MSEETLFECPVCHGAHFHITTRNTLICTTVQGFGGIGCGWKGFLNEPKIPMESAVIPSEHPHGPTDRSDMYYTEGYQKWVEARNRAME